MCTISLKNIMNSTELLPEAGTSFYNELVSVLSEHNKVVIDMSEVTSMPSVFLNVSIGRIIDDYGMEALKKLSFTMITKQQASRLMEYIEKYTSKSN